MKTNQKKKSLLSSATGAATQAQTLLESADLITQPSVRAIRVMCSGRVAREFVLEALRLGAGMVLIGACHLPYDCHYISGNYKMKARTDALKGMLTKLGMSPERFRVEYVSAAEGIHYAEVIKEIDAQMKGTWQREDSSRKRKAQTQSWKTC